MGRLSLSISAACSGSSPVRKNTQELAKIGVAKVGQESLRMASMRSCLLAKRSFRAFLCFLGVGLWSILTFGQTPVVRSFYPARGEPLGDDVYFDGTHLDSVVLVKFNGASAQFYASSTTMRVIVPADATSGPITLHTADGVEVTVGSFEVLPVGPPVIRRVDPLRGWPGRSILIEGEEFNGITNLDFNGTAAVFSGYAALPASSGRLGALVPTNATSGPITISTPFGSFTTAESFEILPFPLAAITWFSPGRGLPGALIEVHVQDLAETWGINTLGRVREVHFGGGTKALFSLSAKTPPTLLVSVPVGAVTGPITLITPEGISASVSSFEVLPYPIGVAFTPDQGRPGTRVDFTGTNLELIVSASINGLELPLNREGGLSFLVPATAESGRISIRSYSGVGYTIPGIFRVIRSIPVIAGFIPESGSPGSAVDIVAQSAGSSAEQVERFSRVTSVWFGGAAAEFSATSNSLVLRATVPPQATTGPITLMTLEGGVESTNSFLVLPEATFVGFTPDHGPPGTTVELLGSNLNQVVGVRFGRARVPFRKDEGLRFTVGSNALSGPITIELPHSRQTLPTRFTVERDFDLRLLCSEALSNVIAPATIEYTVSIFNQGRETIPDVKVTHAFFTASEYVRDAWQTLTALPAELTNGLAVLSSVPSQGQCVAVGNTVRSELGDLAPYASTTVRIAVRASAAGIVYHLGSLLVADPDPDPSDNRFVSATALVPAGQLSIRQLSLESIELTWPSDPVKWVLSSRQLTGESDWLPVTGAVVVVQGWNRMPLSRSVPGGLYRLTRD